MGELTEALKDAAKDLVLELTKTKFSGAVTIEIVGNLGPRSVTITIKPS